MLATLNSFEKDDINKLRPIPKRMMIIINVKDTAKVLGFFFLFLKKEISNNFFSILSTAGLSRYANINPQNTGVNTVNIQFNHPPIAANTFPKFKDKRYNINIAAVVPITYNDIFVYLGSSLFLIFI